MAIRLDPFVFELESGKQFNASQVHEYIDRLREQACGSEQADKARRKTRARVDRIIRKSCLKPESTLSNEDSRGREICEVVRRYSECMVPFIEKSLARYIGPAFF